MINISKMEVESLRELAKEYALVASLPAHREKMNLWKAFNRLDNVRPMVMIDQLPWHELNIDNMLDCTSTIPFLRDIELKMRQQLVQWKYFPVDMVIEPFITVPFCINNTGHGVEIEEDVAHVDKQNNIVSHAYQNQFENEEDVEKIRDMVITLDEETSKEWFDLAKEIFSDIIPVRQSGGLEMNIRMWDMLAERMNVENIYYDLIDRPEFLHELVGRMTNSICSGIDQMNKLNLFDTSLNIAHCSGIYTDELLPDFGAGIGADSMHSWGYGMAQLFTSASPDVTKEFEIPYISKIAQKFGMMYYGCCERLDDRLDLVHQIPNVRKVSCSPWSNVENFAANLNKSLILSNKPTPSVLVEDNLDTDVVAKHLNRVITAGKQNDVKVEFILKDLSTINNKLENLMAWAQTAMGIVENS